MTGPAYRTIWAVTEGVYSDFRVVALFEREVDAINAKGLGVGDDVTELPCFPAGAMPQRHEYWTASGQILHTELNTTPRVSAFNMVAWTGTDPEILKPRSRPRVTVNVQRNGDNAADPPIRTVVRVVALSQESAVKACSDRLAKIRAEAIEHEAAKPKKRARREYA